MADKASKKGRKDEQPPVMDDEAGALKPFTPAEIEEMKFHLAERSKKLREKLNGNNGG